MPIAALLATLAGIAGSLEVTYGAFAVGGALLGVSVLLLRGPWSIWNATPPAELSPRIRRAAIVAVFALAAFFRFYRLNPPGLWGDDAINGLLAFDVLDGKIGSPFQIVSHSHSYFHALSNYPIAAAFWLFGAGRTTLRLPGVVFGTLCDVLLYATVSPLFGCRAGLLAALFFASSPPQITHAKELVQIVTGQFFQLAGLCLLVRGVAVRRTWLIAGAGLPLAMCVYTYHSARIAPLVAVAYVAACWLAGRRASDAPSATTALREDGPASARRLSRWALPAALAVFALALVPALIGYRSDPNALVQRISATSVWPLVLTEHSLRPLWDSVWRTLLIFHYQQGPEYHWFGIGIDPAVNAVIGFLFLHGLVESLRRWRQPRHTLLLAWFAVGLLPALVTTEAPRVYRAFLAIPPIYVWAALPVVQLLAVPARRASRLALRTLAGVLALAVPLIDFNYYFYHVYTHPSFRWFQGERIVEMARTLRDFGPGWTGYLLSDTFDASHETLLFLARAWNLRIVDVSSLNDVLPLPIRPEKGALFMMSHGTLGAAEAIERMYPGRELIVRRAPPVRSWWFDAWWPIARHSTPQDSIATFYPVGSSEAVRPHLVPAWGLRAQYAVGRERFERLERYPFYNFFPATFAQPFNVTWRGWLSVPDDGDYHIVLTNNGTAWLLIDGRETTAQAAIAPGEHRFELRQRDVPAQARLKIFWRHDGGTTVLVPPAAFSPQSPSDTQAQH